MNPPVRLIADINVLFSGLLGRAGTLNDRLYQRFRQGELRLIFDGEYLKEVVRVLDYPAFAKLGLTAGMAFDLARDLFDLGEYY